MSCGSCGGKFHPDGAKDWCLVCNGADLEIKRLSAELATKNATLELMESELQRAKEAASDCADISEELFNMKRRLAAAMARAGAAEGEADRLKCELKAPCQRCEMRREQESRR